MPRQELHSSTLPIEQMPPILDHANYEGDIILVDSTIADKDYLNELAFMEEAVTIRLEPSSDRNAAMAFPVWVNGKPAEVFQNGRWYEVGYLPVAQVITVRRKVLENIIRAKIDTIHTNVSDGNDPNNVMQRFTSPVHSFSIIEDRNPKGPAWVTEIRRRNL